MQITDYERVWIEGLNRGDASVADDVFASDGVVHINGSPDPSLSVEGFKQMVSGLLSAFPDLRFTVEDQIVMIARPIPSDPGTPADNSRPGYRTPGPGSAAWRTRSWWRRPK